MSLADRVVDLVSLVPTFPNVNKGWNDEGEKKKMLSY